MFMANTLTQAKMSLTINGKMVKSSLCCGAPSCLTHSPHIKHGRSNIKLSIAYLRAGRVIRYARTASAAQWAQCTIDLGLGQRYTYMYVVVACFPQKIR